MAMLCACGSLTRQQTAAQPPTLRRRPPAGGFWLESGVQPSCHHSSSRQLNLVACADLDIAGAEVRVVAPGLRDRGLNRDVRVTTGELLCS
jgi:hypothetical protein